MNNSYNLKHLFTLFISLSSLSLYLYLSISLSPSVSVPLSLSLCVSLSVGWVGEGVEGVREGGWVFSKTVVEEDYM